MPQVGRILIYPIKSLDPLDQDSAEFLPSGPLLGDRRFWLADPQGLVVNGKRTPAVHAIRCRYSGDLATVALWREGESPDLAERFPLIVGHAGLNEWLSHAMGQSVELAEDATTGLPDDLDSPGPTVVAAATLEVVSAWFDWSVDEALLRFRPNLVIEHSEAFWDDRLLPPEGSLGVPFQIGQARLAGTNPCQRCVVPSRHPRSGALTPRFAKRMAELREAQLPAWAPRERFTHYFRLCVNTRLLDAGRIRLGDSVTLDG